MIWVVQPFSSQTLTSAATVTSSPFETPLGRLCGFTYDLSTATTGTYVSCTARLLVTSDSGGSYVTPTDSASAAGNVLLATITSNKKYIFYRFDDLPHTPWTQVQLVSVTDNTITFNSVHLVYTDN